MTHEPVQHPGKVTPEELAADDLYGDKQPPAAKVNKVTLYDERPVIAEPGKDEEGVTR